MSTPAVARSLATKRREEENAQEREHRQGVSSTRNPRKEMRFMFTAAVSLALVVVLSTGDARVALASSAVDDEHSTSTASANGVLEDELLDGVSTPVPGYESADTSTRAGPPATTNNPAGDLYTKSGSRKPRFEEKAFTDQYVVGSDGADGMVFATGSCALQVSEEMKTLLKQMRADLASIKSDMHSMDATISRTRHDITRLQRAAATHSNILDTMGPSSLTAGDSPEAALSEAEKLRKRLDNLIEERKNLDGLCLDTRTGFCPSTLRTWTFAFRTRCCFGTFL